MLACGGLILTGALYLLAQLSVQTGSGDLFWPLNVRSMGTVMMFLPLQLSAIGPIPKRDVAAATGFFNLTRQLGGSIGVALLATLLARREAYHREVLVSNLSASAGATLERWSLYTQAMLAKGFPLAEAKQKALAMLDGVVGQQAAILSFNDTFWATAVLIVVSLPLVLLLGKPAQGMSASAGH
jgi:DHA2 family multidrug resistance protein